MKLARFLAATLLLTGFFASTHPASADSPFGTPDGFEQFAVFVGTGVYDLNAPHPEVPGCFQTQCDGRYFQEEIMGWTPAEILEEELAAKDFFRERFGVDVDAPENAGRVVLISIWADPRIGYRMVHLADADVPSAGWPVRDGAHLAIVTDPDGFELGGEFAGVHLPAGSFLAYGLYNVQTTLPNGQPSGEIVIRFKSGAPIVPDAEGRVLALCELSHPEWGSGLAHASLAMEPLPDGRTRFSVRNVLTFPGAD